MYQADNFHLYTRLPNLHFNLIKLGCSFPFHSVNGRSGDNYCVYQWELKFFFFFSSALFLPAKNTILAVRGKFPGRHLTLHYACHCIPCAVDWKLAWIPTALENLLTVDSLDLSRMTRIGLHLKHDLHRGSTPSLPKFPKWAWDGVENEEELTRGNQIVSMGIQWLWIVPEGTILEKTILMVTYLFDSIHHSYIYRD